MPPSLVAGSCADAPYPVATTLNQCLLSQQVVVGSHDGQHRPAMGEHALKNVSWVAHDQVAYIFPSPRSLHLKNGPATGNWRQINHHSWATTEPVKQDVFTLWLDHGLRPRDASYAYLVVPNLEPAGIAAYQRKGDIVILANSVSLQAVQHRTLRWSQVVFYQAGKIRLSDRLTLRADSPCLVMVKTNKKGLTQMAVSDPSRKLKTLRLAISGRFEGAGDNWQASWDKGSKSSTVLVQLPQEGLAGQSLVLDK